MDWTAHKDSGQVVDEQRGMAVAKVWRAGNETRWEQHLALIAAAPELQAVVKELAETPWEKIAIKSLQAKAAAAIAKAGG
jgi:hypothetical protein